MAQGEYEGVKLLHSISPDLVPGPIGVGTYETDENLHFVLSHFVDMYDEVPDVVDFCKSIADLHHRSMDYSLNAKYGFGVTTCNETIPQHTRWTLSWELFFTEALKDAFRLEEQVHEPSPDISGMLPALCEKVCPRLLRPLETEGRTLRPCLVHGDLWDGNVAVHAKTDKPIIFDASALW